MLSKIFVALTVLTLFWTPLGAQAQAPNPGEPIPKFKLSITALGMENIPELFYLDLEYRGLELVREYKAIAVGQNNRSSYVEIPVEAQAQLYRKETAKEPADQTEPAMVPVIELQTAKNNDQWLLVLHLNPKGKPTYTFLDDSPTAHPPHTVRFANFGKSRIAAVIGSEPHLVRPGENMLLGQPNFQEKSRFMFTFAVEQTEEDPFYKAPIKKLRFRSKNARLLVLYTNFPEYDRLDSEDSGGPSTRNTSFTPMAYRLYDTVEL
jgi:hypothetical protein